MTKIPLLKERVMLRSFLLILFMYSISCQKRHENVQPPSPETSEFKGEGFFNFSSSIDKTILGIQGIIKQRNDQTGFLERFIPRVGFALWENSLIAVGEGTLIHARNIDALNAETDKRKIVYIPFVQPEAGRNTSAILRVVIDGPDTAFKMIYPQAYQRLGFQKTNPKKWNAADLFSLFATFNKDIFGLDKARVNDGRIFGRQKTDTLIATTTGGDVRQSSQTGRDIEISLCTSITSCVYANENPVPELDEPNCTTTTNCTVYWFVVPDDDPYEGGGGDPGGGGGGGSEPGGGGEGPGDMGDDPCDEPGGGEGPVSGGGSTCNEDPWDEDEEEDDSAGQERVGEFRWEFWHFPIDTVGGVETGGEKVDLLYNLIGLFKADPKKNKFVGGYLFQTLRGNMGATTFGIFSENNVVITDRKLATATASGTFKFANGSTTTMTRSASKTFDSVQWPAN